MEKTLLIVAVAILIVNNFSVIRNALVKRNT